MEAIDNAKTRSAFLIPDGKTMKRDYSDIGLIGVIVSDNYPATKKTGQRSRNCP